MLKLKDVRDCIATLNIAADSNCYCGKMADKVDQSVGVYNPKSGRTPIVPIGGLANKSYGTKEVSILVHWNRSVTETETATINLYNALQQCNNVTINEQTIKFITMQYEEPISVSTDENGIFEYVIDCVLYYDI